jgi:glucose/arabinose dehydrogenase
MPDVFIRFNQTNDQLAMKKNVHPNRLLRAVRLLLLFLLLSPFQSIQAQTFPVNFAGIQVATGLDPVGIDIAPDGRVFLAEKNGKIRIVKNGTLLTTPFITIPNVDNWNERGLLKVILDPGFNTNQYVYAYYTYKAPGGSVSNNRVSRFTANGDVAVAGSELVLIDIDPLGEVGYHNGGGIGIKNGRLYISVGENTVASNAQSFTTLKGKVLCINTDGGIPTDNPFYNTTTGKNRAIYALGFRNPFRLSVQPGTGKIFVNDVGNSTWEEIDEVLAGKNYGWPGIEGVRTNQTAPANYQDPLYAYDHGNGCSITAGQFYNPTTANFPTSYIGKYFFGDYCNGWLKNIDPSTKAVATFATGIDRPLDVAVSNDGTLYFIARGGISGGSDEANTSSTNGVIWKVNYTGNGIPVVAVNPVNKTVSAGEPVTFIISASGNPTPTYQWQRNGVNIAGANAASYTIANTTLSDNGAKFRVVVSNSAGSATSTEATLTVLNNALPVATITAPTVGTKYSGGDVITFSGTGTDTEDGNLPDNAFTWKIDLYHYDNPPHTHPALEPVSGIRSGTFTIPVEMETSAHVLFRIYLTVKDSKGASNTVFVEINPNTSNTTLATNPAGLSVKLDGSALASPYTFTGASQIQREIEVASPQVLNGVTYVFSSWSDGGARAHTISTPAVNSTITANFVPATGIVAGGVYELEPQHAIGKRLDVNGGNTADKASVEIYQSNGGNNQRWKLIDKGNNVYELEPQHAIGKRLDVAGASAADEAKVQTYSSNNGNNQRWKFYDQGNGIYELEPQHALGKRLDIVGASATNQAKAQIYHINGGQNQKWKLILISNSALREAETETTTESNELLSIFPNPFQNETTITFQKPNGSDQAFILVRSKTGELLKEINVSNNAGSVVLNSIDFTAGEYFYTLVVDGKPLTTKRFVVVR